MTVATSETKLTLPRSAKVLHVVAMLDNGGGERWVVDLCEYGRRENLTSEIAVLWEIEGMFAARARQLNIPVHRCLRDTNPLRYIARLRKLLRERGPFDAVHSHTHAHSCFVVLAAWLEGVPVRIAQSHNVIGNWTHSLGRRAYITFARTLIGMFATAGFGPSLPSLEDLFGVGCQKDPRWRRFPCGLNLSGFRSPSPPGADRASLGIPADAIVFGSVGRLSHEKNSSLLVDILAAAVRRTSNIFLLLIGAGPLREELLAKAAALGVADRFLLPGTRTDVPLLMRDVMDVFLFPSPPPPRGNEALPLAVVEAQAAGVPLVISDGVPPDTILVADLVTQIRADDSAEIWADNALKAIGTRSRLPAHRSLEIVESSHHNLSLGIKVLARIYRDPKVTAATAVSEGK